MPDLLLQTLSATVAETPVLELPGTPSELGLWIWSGPDVETPGVAPIDLIGESDLDRFGLQGQLRTALGDRLNVSFVPGEQDGYPADGWRYFRTDLPALSADSYPLALELLSLRNRSRTAGGFTRQYPNEMELALDEITVVERQTGGAQIAADFEETPASWVLTQPDSQATIGTVQSHSGQRSLLLQLHLGSTDTAVLRPGVAPLFDQPLPVLASPAFLASTEATIGDVLNVAINSQPAQVQLAGQVNYFPTLYEDQNAGFLVTNRDLLLGFVNGTSLTAVNPNEVLIKVDEAIVPENASAEAQSLLPGISETWEAETLRRTIKADPMGLGLRSVTYFGYVLTTTLSLVGFATYFYLSARQRESLYSVLRSIGLSPGQLYGALVLEQIVLILAGLTIGTVLGVLLNQLTLPGLPITFGDRPPTPPFIARNDWLAVGRIYLTLAIAFLVCLGVATALLMRTNLHRALRVGEE
jgi:hypothetical protein